jgi:hypothetical protein
MPASAARAGGELSVDVVSVACGAGRDIAEPLGVLLGLGADAAAVPSERRNTCPTTNRLGFVILLSLAIVASETPVAREILFSVSPALTVYVAADEVEDPLRSVTGARDPDWLAQPLNSATAVTHAAIIHREAPELMLVALTATCLSWDM